MDSLRISFNCVFDSATALLLIGIMELAEVFYRVDIPGMGLMPICAYIPNDVLPCVLKPIILRVVSRKFEDLKTYQSFQATSSGFKFYVFYYKNEPIHVRSFSIDREGVIEVRTGKYFAICFAYFLYFHIYSNAYRILF